MSEPLNRLTAVAALLRRDNIDTDAIIPSREMKSTGKTGLADGLFAGWRYRDIGGREPDPDFILNAASQLGTKILISGSNFGCGSSREHAVWALAEYGVRVIIAPSFAPIFAANCVRNGVLCAKIDAHLIDDIARYVTVDPQTSQLSVDLSTQTVTAHSGEIWSFPLDPEAKSMLIEGLDAIDLTLKHRLEIAKFHARDLGSRPWVYWGVPNGR